MRKQIEILRANKKRGFTLIELIITIFLLSLVLGLLLQLSNSFYKRYQQIEERWIVQNAAKRVMQYFEMQNEALSNSASISLFYSPEEQPISDYDDDLPPTVMQGVPAVGNDTYAYIYSKPSDDPELGDMIYVLERGEGNVPVSLTKVVLGEEIPLKIDFSVSVEPVAVTRNERPTLPDGSPMPDEDIVTKTDKEGNTYYYAGGQEEYLRTTVDITISTPSSAGGNYKLTTSYTMNNMMQNQQVNHEGSGVVETAPGRDIGVAGWSDENLPCPVDTTVYPYADHAANILRYVSAESFLNSQNTGAADLDIQGAGLCFGNLVMQGSSMETQVKGALRDFRDNVLRKTALGNLVIEKYYNEWSPALVAAATENPALKVLGKIVLIPASIVALFVAD